jgi:hypothetical protein
LTKKVGFDPGKRNSVSKELESALALKGIDLTDETIHNILENACKYLEAAASGKTSRTS